MLRLIQADFYRLFHSKSFYVILLAIFGMASIVLSFHFFPAIGPNEATYKLVLKMKNEAWNTKVAFQGALATYPFLIYLFISFFIMSSGYEFSQKCYKNTLTSGVSRATFCIAKNTVQWLMVTLGTAIYFGLIFIFSYFKYGMTDSDSGSLVNDMLYAGFCLALGISFILSLANIILIITTSNVAATVFIAVSPLLIPMIRLNTGWNWVVYFDFVTLAQSMAFYELSGKALFPYIVVYIVLIICSTTISISVIKRKEL
ncbi:hypothetical protein A5881_000717 [Enterococcus termitis]|nr:hypothetical protein A5881_000921 [Enterococcus termitis]